MIKTNSLLTILTVLLAATSSFAKTTMTVDPSSKVTWKGTKKIGSAHNGQIKIQSGSVTFEKDQPVGAEITIDMSSLSDDDLTDKEMNTKLVTHLKSGDFFDAAKYPTAKLNVTKFTKNTDTNYSLDGDLTIKDATKPISLINGAAKPILLKADLVKNGPDQKVVKSVFTFDRTQFGLKYGSENFFKNLGDKVINDQVEVSVELTLKAEAKK